MADAEYQTRYLEAERKSLDLCAEKGWIYVRLHPNLKEFVYSIPYVDSIEPFYHAIPSDDDEVECPKCGGIHSRGGQGSCYG